MARAEACARPALSSLLLPFLTCWGASDDATSATSLSQAQRRGLASIIALTYEDETKGEGACALDSLVRDADAAFTKEASDDERTAMWSVDDGAALDAVTELRRRVLERLGASEADVEKTCGPRSTEQRRRAAVALVNACLGGRSARFQLEASVADQFLDQLGGFWCAVAVAGVLAFAAVGALAAVDSLVVTRVLGARGPTRVPCACKVCEGRLKLSEKVGEGGFGSVWRCGGGVVVKLVRVDLEHDVNALKGVLDEARHLLELRHEHVVEYIDTFVHRETASGKLVEDTLNGGVADFACIAMEDCAGGSLLDHVAATGVPFPLGVLVEVARQCATALAYAHGRGVVHRDIKLENIFVQLADDRATIKIGDFGLAVRGRVQGGAAGGGGRSSSSVGGTEVYQPPECFTDEDVMLGAAVDAWGLGCVVFEMATSQSLPTEPPFLGQLLLEPDAAKHTKSLQTTFASSLETAAQAAAQDRSDSPAKQKKRASALAGLRTLLARLLAAAPEARPELARVAAEPWLHAARGVRLEDFFRFATRPHGAANARARSRRARMFRAKSLPRNGGTPVQRARRAPASPTKRASPGRARSGGGL